MFVRLLQHVHHGAFGRRRFGVPSVRVAFFITAFAVLSPEIVKHDPFPSFRASSDHGLEFFGKSEIRNELKSDGINFSWYEAGKYNTGTAVFDIV